MVCSVYYLDCMVININVLFAEWSITERDYFQILLLGILSSMGITIFIFGYGCCATTTTLQVLVNTYIFPQLQTFTVNDLPAYLSADCTVGACSSNIVIFDNCLAFNFPFFNFDSNFLFPGLGKGIPSSFLILYSTINQMPLKFLK